MSPVISVLSGPSEAEGVQVANHPAMFKPLPRYSLPRGATAARLVLLGFFLIDGLGGLWLVVKTLPRLQPGVGYLWMFATLPMAMAALEGIALLWLARVRPMGCFLAALALAVHAVRGHVPTLNDPALQPQDPVETATLHIVTWTITLFLSWLIVVFIRMGLAFRSRPMASVQEG